MRKRSSGYVLIMVSFSLALIALVATRFATRIDDLRAQARQAQEAAAAQLAVHNTWARSLYWLATRAPNALGYSGQSAPLPALTWMVDDRLYRTEGGSVLSLQDLRGLLPINAAIRPALLQLLLDHGVELQRAQAMIDVLEDYIDTDRLKRLNGAERDEYAALGLAVPRDDFLKSVNELARMPLWRGDLDLLMRIEPLFSVLRDSRFNPAAAPMPVIRARAPGAREEQYKLFEVLRRDRGFLSGQQATEATGLMLRRDDEYYYYASEELRLSLWAPGLPRPVQYTFQLTPSGPNAPWAVFEVRSDPRPTPDLQTRERASLLPLDAASAPASSPVF